MKNTTILASLILSSSIAACGHKKDSKTAASSQSAAPAGSTSTALAGQYTSVTTLAPNIIALAIAGQDSASLGLADSVASGNKLLAVDGNGAVTNILSDNIKSASDIYSTRYGFHLYVYTKNHQAFNVFVKKNGETKVLGLDPGATVLGQNSAGKIVFMNAQTYDPATDEIGNLGWKGTVRGGDLPAQRMSGDIVYLQDQVNNVCVLKDSVSLKEVQAPCIGFNWNSMGGSKILSDYDSTNSITDIVSGEKVPTTIEGAQTAQKNYALLDDGVALISLNCPSEDNQIHLCKVTADGKVVTLASDIFAEDATVLAAKDSFVVSSNGVTKVLNKAASLTDAGASTYTSKVLFTGVVSKLAIANGKLMYTDEEGLAKGIDLSTGSKFQVSSADKVSSIVEVK